jgi:hypothetical protein
MIRKMPKQILKAHQPLEIRLNLKTILIISLISLNKLNLLIQEYLLYLMA